MNDESPFEGPVPDDGDDAPYEWLDEWLCEYVDGTMDPSLEAVFEQYVEANPELKAHIERLQQTRDLLCECGLPRESSPEVETDLCAEAECDPMASSASVSDAIRDRPVLALGMASSIAVALVVGFLVGATVVAPPSSPFSSPPTAVEQTTVSDPAPPLRRTQTPAREGPSSLRRPAASFSSADSTSPPSPLTEIGLP
jgi:anti-sigma factor RsiW